MTREQFEEDQWIYRQQNNYDNLSKGIGEYDDGEGSGKMIFRRPLPIKKAPKEKKAGTCFWCNKPCSPTATVCGKCDLPF